MTPAAAAETGAGDPSGRYLAEPTGSFWKSLRYLADARFIVAGLLLAYVPLLGREAALQQGFDRRLFLEAAGVYLILAAAFAVTVRVSRRGFHVQLLTQVVLDILTIGVIVYAAGGARSGLGILMLTPTAGAAILSTPLVSLAIAAAASLVLLAESGWRALEADGGGIAGNGMIGAAASGDLPVAAVISMVLFVTAVIVNRLARRLTAQESLAIRHGADLRNQRAINAQVIAELDQGVVVFDRAGTPKGMNPMARRILGLAEGVSLDRADPVALERLRVLIGSNRSVTAFSIGEAGERRENYRARVLTGDDPLADRVVLLEDLERIEERAQQLKLASMGRLSASIAHEIRNPLGAIRHAGNLLAEQVPDGPLRRMTTIIEENSLRIDRIVEDVLSIARRSATREPVDLPAFLNGFLPEFVAQTDTSWERITVSLDCPDAVLFDPNHLRQVLVNLLSNALRYASDTPGAILIAWSRIGDRRAVLRVADDGPGIAPAHRDHLFEPFFTTEARGTGLGLHMAQELCAANAADLRYESAPGETTGAATSGAGRYGGAFVIEPERALRRAAAASSFTGGAPGSATEPDSRHGERAWQRTQTA